MDLWITVLRRHPTHMSYLDRQRLDLQRPCVARRRTLMYLWITVLTRHPVHMPHLDRQKLESQRPHAARGLTLMDSWINVFTCHPVHIVHLDRHGLYYQPLRIAQRTIDTMAITARGSLTSWPAHRDEF